MYLRFGHRVIVGALKCDFLAKNAIPSNKEVVSYKEAIVAIYPLLYDVWSTIDRLKLHLQQSGNTEIQACFYNGLTHGHYVTSVFIFGPDGTIPIAFSILQDPYMTAKSHIGGEFMISSVPCIRRLAESAQLIRLSVR